MPTRTGHVKRGSRRSPSTLHEIEYTADQCHRPDISFMQVREDHWSMHAIMRASPPRYLLSPAAPRRPPELRQVRPPQLPLHAAVLSAPSDVQVLQGGEGALGEQRGRALIGTIRRADQLTTRPPEMQVRVERARAGAGWMG